MHRFQQFLIGKHNRHMKNSKVKNNFEEATPGLKRIHRNISRFIKSLVALSTIVVGYATIKVMLSQRDMQEQTLQMQKLEHQPKFTVGFSNSYFKDSTNIKFENISISNLGEKITHCDEPKIITYLDVKYTEHRFPQCQHYYFHIPYTDYFDLRSTVRLQGEIAVGHENYNVAKHLSEFFSTSPPNPFPDCKIEFAFQTIHMIHISYQDIYNEHHDIYFKGSDEIEESLFKQYYDDSTLEEGDIFDPSTLKKGSFFNYSLAKLNFDQIFEYIKFLKKNSTEINQQSSNQILQSR